MHELVRSLSPVISPVAVMVFTLACSGVQERLSPAGHQNQDDPGIATLPVASAQPLSKHDFEAALIEGALAGLELDPDAGTLIAMDGSTADPLASTAAFEQGEVLLHEKNHLLDALASYNLAIQLDPVSARGYLGLGKALTSLGDSRRAELAFAVARRLEPEWVAVGLAQAILLQSTGRDDEAHSVLIELAENTPANGELENRLARAHYLAGDLVAARRHAERAAGLGRPLPEQLVRLISDDASPPRRLAVSGGESAGDEPHVGPPVRVDPGAGEAPTNETSSAGVAAPGEDIIVASFNDYQVDQEVNLGVALSLDGGQSWADSLLQPPPANAAPTEGDPMTAYDPRDGTLWVGAIAFAPNGGLYVARKEAGDADFRPAVFAGQETFADKCWMAAGRLIDDPGGTAVYIAYNEGIRRSLDRGDTWELSANVPIGQGFVPRIGPGGELYVSYLASSFASANHELIRSLDNGETMSAALTIAEQMQPVDDTDFPGRFRVLAYGSLAVDPVDGQLFYVYPDVTGLSGGRNNIDLYFVRSSDGGSNWSTPVILNGDSEPAGDQFFPWLEADDAGRLHLVFYDSRHTNQPDHEPDGLLDAYYAYSDDDGDSWSEIRLSDSSFNSLDSFNETTQFMGDYLGLAIAGPNAYPTYLSTISGFSEIYVHAITREPAPALSLTGPDPGRAGEGNTFTASGATPGAEIYILYGTQRGSTAVPGCTGVEVDFEAVVMGTAIANASGDAELAVEIPVSVSGRSPRFQAVEAGGCGVSNLVVFDFPDE